jgi:hypothetical protein
MLFLASLQPARAQPAPGETLVEQVAGLNRSMQRLVTLLERSLDQQEADLLLKRIDLRERRLAPLERELRSTKSGLLNDEAEMARVREMLEQQQDTLQREIREGTDRPNSDTRRLIADLELAVKTESDRHEALRRRVRELEDELAEGRERIEILEEFLQQLIE